VAFKNSGKSCNRITDQMVNKKKNEKKRTKEEIKGRYGTYSELEQTLNQMKTTRKIQKAKKTKNNKTIRETINKIVMIISSIIIYKLETKKTKN